MIYPNKSTPGTVGDVMPNCLHGSSTSNIHFHGTHTTPSTTGDNVLLFVRPALRSGTDRSIIRPAAPLVNSEFDKVFAACEANGSPTRWSQLPLAWRADQERLLKEYDRTAPYQGRPGTLPHDMQLWPANKMRIDAGVGRNAARRVAIASASRTPTDRRAAGAGHGTGARHALVSRTQDGSRR